MRFRTLSAWVLVIPGVFLQVAGLDRHDPTVFGLGTAVQGIGLWIQCRSSERSGWWALLALLPVLGWLGVVGLQRRARLEALAREKANRTRAQRVGRAVGAVCALMVVGVCALPQAALFGAHQEGHKLVALLEGYEQRHGVYPDSLEALGVPLEYPSRGWRGIRYRTHSDGSEFYLTCFAARFGSTDERETYDSSTKRWRRYR